MDFKSLYCGVSRYLIFSFIDWQINMNGKLNFKRTKLLLYLFYTVVYEIHLWFCLIIVIIISYLSAWKINLKIQPWQIFFEKFSTFTNELRFYYLALSKLDHLKLLRLYEWKYFATAGQRGVYWFKNSL